MLPAAVGFYVDKLQSGEFQESPGYYSILGFCFLFLYSLMLVNSWVFKKELILTENASRSLSLFGMSILHSLPIKWHANQATGRKLNCNGCKEGGIGNFKDFTLASYANCGKPNWGFNFLNLL